MIVRVLDRCIGWVHLRFSHHPLIGTVLLLCGPGMMGFLIINQVKDVPTLAFAAAIGFLGLLILARCPRCPHLEDEDSEGPSDGSTI